jgi:hypothetical protein
MSNATTKQEDVCLVMLVGSVNEVEKNCGMPSISIVHNNISNVESVHNKLLQLILLLLKFILLLQHILFRLKLCSL